MLQNNAQDMKTVTETFFIEETETLVSNPDDLTKWDDLVSFLELPNQSKLAKGNKSPVPFLWINGVLLSVLETLCPRKVELSDYDKTPIPLEVLEVVALSKREGYFDLIQIWYDEGTPDPCAIGYIFDNSRDGEWMRQAYAKKYLLARWADVKSSFEELTQRAHERYVLEQTITLREHIKSAQRQLEDLADSAKSKFGLVKPGLNTNSTLPF